jgi:hypothetical protein
MVNAGGGGAFGPYPAHRRDAVFALSFQLADQISRFVVFIRANLQDTP